MDIRKHMAEYFERTGFASKQPARFDLDHIIKEKTVHNKVDRKHRSSPVNPKALKLERIITKSSSLHRSLSSQIDSNRASRKSSPVRNTNKPARGFKEKLFKGISDLVKLRNLKLKKVLEFAGKEIAIIQQLKKMVAEEIELCKGIEEKRIAEEVNERIKFMAKTSAEELFIYEQKIKITTEENQMLRNKIERLGKKDGHRITGINDCLNELSDKASDYSTMLIAEPLRSHRYLSDIQKLSEDVMADLQQKDLNALTGVLALQLSREKMLHEQKKRQMNEKLNDLKSARDKLENICKLSNPFSYSISYIRLF